VRRLLLGAVLLILACEGAATLPAPSQKSPVAAPTAMIDVSDMMGAFPAATFFVVTDDGVKAVALLNHATKYAIPTIGAVQVASRGGQIYVADEPSGGTRLRSIEQASGAVIASRIEPSRRLAATAIGHGAIAIEPVTNRVLALYADGDRRAVEAYEPGSLNPLGRRFDSGCGDRLLAGAARVVVSCFSSGELVISDMQTKPAVISVGLGPIVAAAMSLDGATLVGRADGTLALLPPFAMTVERVEPFRPARLVPDGIASPQAQNFAIGLITSDSDVGISELRAGRRYISFPAASSDSHAPATPVGGLLANELFAFWSTGREARHIDLQQGFAETMATFSGTLALPGGVGE
jgi:hypothetical protein